MKKTRKNSGMTALAFLLACAVVITCTAMEVKAATEAGVVKTQKINSGTDKSFSTNSGTSKSGTGNYGKSSNKTTKKTMTYDEWFAENYPYVLNDVTSCLPYSNMIGAKLADLKDAVEKDERYSEETSTWTKFTTMTGFTLKSGAKIDYAFSNRKMNAKGENAAQNGFWKGLDSLAQGKSLEEALNDGLDEAGKTLGRNFSKGAANAISSSVEDAIYYYVRTDGSKDQIINRVYLVAGGDIQDAVWEPFEKTFYNTEYGTFQASYNQKKYDVTYLKIKGTVSKIDKQKTYESLKKGITDYEGSGFLYCYPCVNGTEYGVLEFYGSWLE